MVFDKACVLHVLFTKSQYGLVFSVSFEGVMLYQQSRWKSQMILMLILSEWRNTRNVLLCWVVVQSCIFPVLLLGFTFLNARDVHV